MYREETARAYAKLIIRTGVNLQKGQLAILNAPIENAEFARMVLEEAYRAGARDVLLRYFDDKASRLRYQYAHEDALTNVPAWKYTPIEEYAKAGAAYICIESDDPDAFFGIDSERLGKGMNAEARAKKPFQRIFDKNEIQWTVVAAAGRDWAKKVFPGVDEQWAIQKLWDAIYHTTRMDTPDPQKAWAEHSASLRQHCDFLNASGITRLHLENSLGTNLEIGLIPGAIWAGGSEKTVGGIEFEANMPTEEVFTAPHREKVNGKVVSTLPLNYQGVLIEDFWFVFRDGLIVEYGARQGKAALDQIFQDENCRRLGEIALVPYDSLVRQAQILFYSTLFDENASCHMALGSAYTSSVAGGEKMSLAEKEQIGLNEAYSHIDFMFGSRDLRITGYTEDGREIPLFRDGNWVSLEKEILA